MKDGKFNIGISVTVRVTLKDGTYHEDIGYGQMENAKKAQAFEKAKKEGTTDALKRALRSFGNVLGNCLYDKEYLARITRVRAPTVCLGSLVEDAKLLIFWLQAAFDEKRLHRHGDSMQIPPQSKKEPVAPIVPKVEAAPTSAPTSDESVFDDYGGDDLEELGIFAGDETFDDLMPDEVAIDDSPPFDTPSKPAPLQTNNDFGRNTLAMPRQPSAPSSPTKQVPRSFAPPPQTTAAIRPQTNGAQAQQQQQPKPQPPQPPQQRPNMPTPAPRSNMQPPPARPQTNLPGPAAANRTPAIGAPRPNVPGNNAPNPPGANSANNSAAPSPAPPANKPTSPIRSAGAPQAPTTPGPANPPIGFFTARAAMSLNSENDVIPEAAPTFNPHRVTTIPRTAGIDHTKSSPIPRKVLGQASQGPPPGIAPSPANFQNPSMAAVRQIGMPPRGTGAFKSPSMAGIKRGPQGGLPPPGGGGLGGSGDVKRPRNGA